MYGCMHTCTLCFLIILGPSLEENQGPSHPSVNNGETKALIQRLQPGKEACTSIPSLRPSLWAPRLQEAAW